MEKSLREVVRILESIGTETPCIRGTDLYNEGWLLRLVLAAGFKGIDCLPFPVEPESRWFSEALLPSAFRQNFMGDKAGESATHADGVVGQFRFAPGTKAGLVLEWDCRQFVVCEAKIFSKLSPGTKNAPSYDQAARTVACMARVLSDSGQPLPRVKSLGFYAIAPESHIHSADFSSKMDRSSIRRGIAERVAMYHGQPNHLKLESWMNAWVIPLVERIDLGCCSWESIIDKVRLLDSEAYASIREFYDLCLKYNA